MMDQQELSEVAHDIAGEMIKARKPLLMFGAGCRLPEARELLRLTKIPGVTSWGARDYFPDCVSFGTHGLPPANQAVQTADYILCIGCRLDTKATADVKQFAPKAKLV